MTSLLRESTTSFVRILVGVLASLYFLNYARTPDAWHFIDAVNLVFHEAGHTIIFFLGDFIQAAAGSGMQVFIPAVITGYFFFKREYFSSLLTLLWLGSNIINVSVYASDAYLLQLPLLGGDSVTHDWNYLLSELDILKHALAIGQVFYGIGAVCILVGVAGIAYVCFLELGKGRSNALRS